MAGRAIGNTTGYADGHGPVGRRRRSKTVKYTIRLDESERDALVREAARRGMAVADVVRSRIAMSAAAPSSMAADSAWLVDGLLAAMAAGLAAVLQAVVAAMGRGAVPGDVEAAILEHMREAYSRAAGGAGTGEGS